jgi:TonB family protein
MHGHVVLTFTINREGRLSDLSVRRPSAVDAFTNSAFNAMSLSNPTHPLPPEYPEEFVVFTVTFYFNETPPSRLPRSR